MTTPVLGITELAQSQAQPHVLINGAITTFDGIVQLSVVSFAAAPTGAEPTGTRYIVIGGTGAFAGQSSKVAVKTATGWAFYAPLNGWLAFVEDTGASPPEAGRFYYYDLAVSPAGWTELQTGGTGSASPTTTEGDLIVRGATVDERLPVGSEDQVLTVVGGVPAWVDSAGGGAAAVTVSDGAMVYRGASAQTVTTGTHTSVTFDTEERDDGTYATLGTNNDRLTVANAGWYLVQGTCGFSMSSGGYRSLYIMVSGDTTQRHFQQTLANAGPSLNTVLNVAGIVYLSSGSYVQLRAYQDSGGDLTIPVSTTQKNPRLSLHRLGAYGYTPAGRYERMWDFDTTHSVPGSSAADAEWSNTTSGSGALSIPDSELDHPGIVRITAGATAGSTASLQQAPSGSTIRRTYFLDSTPLIIEVLVKVANVPDATDATAFSFGLRDSNAYANRAQMSLTYDSGSARVRTHTTNASTSTVGTGTTYSGTGWKHMRLVCTSSAVSGYLNGTLIDTVTTNIPTAGMNIFFICALVSGASRNYDVDLVRVYKDFSSPRYTS